MSLGLLLVILGVVIALLVHWTLGLLLIVVGLVLLVVPALRMTGAGMVLTTVGILFALLCVLEAR